MLKTSLTLLVMTITCLSYSQELPKEYEKKYEIYEKINDHIIIQEKKNNYNKIILDNSSQKIAEFEEKKPLIFVSDNGKVYYSSQIKGFNDGGGWITTHFDDVEILNLSDKSIQKYDFNILYANYRKSEIIIIKKDDLLGAINKKEEIVLKPIYNSINATDFEKNHFIVMDQNEYFITDKYGKNILDKNFVNKKNNNRTDGIIFDDQYVESSFDGLHFGLYDYISKQTVIPEEYTSVSPFFKSKKYYKVHKNDTCAVFNLTSKTFDLPFAFGATHVSEAISKNIDGSPSVFFTYNKKTNQTDSTNIYWNGEKLIKGDFDIKDINFDRFPFITGRDKNNKRYIYNFDNKSMIMYGLEYIELFHEMDYWKENKSFILVKAILNHPKLPKGPASTCSMLLNTEGKVIVPFISKQSFKNYTIGDQNYIMNFYPNQTGGSITVDFRSEKGEIIAKDLITKGTHDVKISDNKISVFQLPTASFTIPNKGTFTGGVITIDVKGNLEHIPAVDSPQQRRPTSTRRN